MNTHNKIQLGERDPGSLKRTVSGGVSEPSDPSHYPDLSGSPSPRASSRLSQSFKSTVMADNDEDAVLHGAASRSTQSSASPERTASPSGSQGSPKIPAQRHTSSLSPSSACLIDTTAAASNRQQHLARLQASRNAENDRWEPVSPRRQVSTKRRTADYQAEKAIKEGTIYNIPAHPNTFDALQEEEEGNKVDNSPQVLSDKILDKVADCSQILGDESSNVSGRQGGKLSTRRFSSGSTRGVYQDLWDRAEAVYDTIVENPGKTAAVVSLTVIGMLVFVRQRRFLK